MIAGAQLARSTRLNAIDFALSGSAGMAAVYSVGASISRSDLGNIFATIIFLGTAFSWLMSETFKSRETPRFGAIAYTAAFLLSLFFALDLNHLLPDEGFTRELWLTSALCWMISLGSWFAWNDARLLFQAIPCISLFALVGAFSTYSGATFMFFVFLLGNATLHARAHQRAMLRRAAESGYERLAEIRQGPWRWMAGPEWALLSAAAVVLVSLLGAPILQESVQGVAGIVRITPPRVRRAIQSAVGSTTAATNLRVGQGPRELSERVVLRANLDRPRHLRIATFGTYTGLGWSAQEWVSAGMSVLDSARADRVALSKSENLEEIEFRIVTETPEFDRLPVPGEPIRVVPAETLQYFLDGTLRAPYGLPPKARYSGTSMVPKSSVVPRSGPLPVPEHLWAYADLRQVDFRLTALGDQVARDKATDFEKTLALKAEIERRCVYNLRAEKTPAGVDPVVHFLFGETREGYCDLFASAMALLARSQGIPSRVATGYYPVSGIRDGTGAYIVREADAHAWAELYFEGIGWVVFDATEGAGAIEGNGRGTSTLALAIWQRPAVQRAAMVIGAVAFLYGAFRVSKIVRAARAHARLEPVALAKAYLRFANLLHRAGGRPRRPAETTQEFVEALEHKLGVAHLAAARLGRDFERALYAPEDDDRPRAEELERGIRELEEALREARREQQAGTREKGQAPGPIR